MSAFGPSRRRPKPPPSMEERRLKAEIGRLREQIAKLEAAVEQAQGELADSRLT